MFAFEQLRGKESVSGNLIQNHFFVPFRKLACACVYGGIRWKETGS